MVLSNWVNIIKLSATPVTSTPSFRKMHDHRAEHWIVVSGIAKVTIGDSQFLVTENRSNNISAGQVNFVERPGLIPLKLFEVMFSSCLAGTDIGHLKDYSGLI